ncbi:NAD(P)H-binding protein [Flammeovirga aprica]|uniref:SDR family oxidoreductase n=1 Tax=Flammeovirga aprica JL-4 TaxID=694437 RepID=A0A7X9S0G9_9BACT|nr:NAD(P)H-binding protein [Flammeovirga aprica]NME72150.1 SDR family oxidoreductase [Flammeovirga aprica JL-4]
MISNLFLRNTMKDHNLQETYIINSNLPYHIVRPVGLTDDASKGEVQVENEGALPSYNIPKIDVENYLVKSLMEGKRGFSGISQMS